MIPSEIASNLRYTYDVDNNESNIRIDSENLQANSIYSTFIQNYGTLETGSLRVDHGFDARNGITLRSDLVFSNANNDNLCTLTYRNAGNKQIYYHCIKLTSATKTAYVNLYTEKSDAINAKTAFIQAVIGSGSLQTVNWTYASGDKLVRFYHAESGVKCTIDDEDITAVEDLNYNNNAIYKTYHVAESKE